MNDIKYELPYIKTDIPGEKSKKWAHRLKKSESPNLTYVDQDFPIFWEKASGCLIEDVDGNILLDLNASFAVAGVGHSHPEIVKTIYEQSIKIIHGMGDVHPSTEKVILAEKLQDITPNNLNKCIFSNSGSDAVDAALKTAIKYTGKNQFISFSGAYHGLNTGALQVTAHEHFRKSFTAQLFGESVILPYPNKSDIIYNKPKNYDDDSLINFLDWNLSHKASGYDNIAGIILEPIQGRGGIMIPSKKFIKNLKDLCLKHKILMIFDEIYTGMGRTGTMFASNYFNVVPDILIIGKALGGGLAIGACIATDEVMDAWGNSKGEAEYTHTFTGHPLTMAVGTKVIEIIKNLLPNVKKRSILFEEELNKLKEKYDFIREIRGIGLMWGMEIVKSNELIDEPDKNKAIMIMKKALKNGLILLTSGVNSNVITFTPPYIITEQQIKFSFEVIDKICKDLQ